jgi:myosin-crossreactive antigen
MYDISYPGIVQWNKMVFEKLGYMVLAHHHHHDDATESYKQCIQRLIEAIEENQKLEGISANRLHDYSSMHSNLLILLKHCNKDFHFKPQSHNIKNNKEDNLKNNEEDNLDNQQNSESNGRNKDLYGGAKKLSSKKLSSKKLSSKKLSSKKLSKKASSKKSSKK